MTHLTRPEWLDGPSSDERDISHWAEWSDDELIDQAACGCQHRALIDDQIVRESIAMNIIAPFRQALAKARGGQVQA